MLSDKQFEDAFTTAEGWFVATYYELVADWQGENSDLVEIIFAQSTDEKRTGTNARISALRRIIENHRGGEALQKVVSSARIAKRNPEAVAIAKRILWERFS